MESRNSFVCESQALKKVVEMAHRVALLPVTVLITGETGTGKELIARLVHKLSGRTGPFVVVNCTAIPRDLFESELFGSKRGSFSGSFQDRDGFVPIAKHGTLFLDEIGDMPAYQQAKILRLLDTRDYNRVGEPEARIADCRFIAATHVNLQESTLGGKFRADLLYRLGAFRICVPPLRTRREDIQPLVDLFLSQAETTLKTSLCLSPRFKSFVLAHAWPGNVRELRDVIMQAAIMHQNGVVDLPAGTTGLAAPPVLDDGFTVSERHERELILRTVQCYPTQREAASYLGIGEKTLRNKLRLYRLAEQPAAAKNGS